MTSLPEWAIAHSDLLKVLFYNPDTGVFTWQIDVGSKIQAGDRAGYPHQGYRRVRINNMTYQEHRLVFFYMTKKWPVAEIDHINRVKDDNRWSNLREATRQQNNRNTTLRKDNLARYKGVGFRKDLNKYTARIRINTKLKYLGAFDTPEAASAAYEAAAKEQFGEFYPNKLN